MFTGVFVAVDVGVFTGVFVGVDVDVGVDDGVRVMETCTLPPGASESGPPRLATIPTGLPALSGTGV